MATPLATLVRARTLGTALPTVLAGLLLLGTGTASAAPPAAPSPASSSATGLAALNPTDRASVAAELPPPDVPGSALAVTVVPNPVRGRAEVTVAVRRGGPVRVAVVDVLGREAAVLHAGALGVGMHRFAVPGRGLSPGVYVVVVTGSEGTHGQPFTVVR